MLPTLLRLDIGGNKTVQHTNTQTACDISRSACVCVRVREKMREWVCTERRGGEGGVNRCSSVIARIALNCCCPIHVGHSPYKVSVPARLNIPLRAPSLSVRNGQSSGTENVAIKYKIFFLSLSLFLYPLPRKRRSCSYIRYFSLSVNLFYSLFLSFFSSLFVRNMNKTNLKRRGAVELHVSRKMRDFIFRILKE